MKFIILIKFNNLFAMSDRAGLSGRNAHVAIAAAATRRGCKRLPDVALCDAAQLGRTSAR